MLTNKINILIYILPIIILSFISCKNEAKKNEEELLRSYIEDNDIQINARKSGLYYLPNDTSIVEDFSTDFFSEGDTIIMAYKGYLLSDTSVIFTEKNRSEYSKYVYKINDFIKGFEEGVSYMEKGVKAIFLIPSDIAYGKERVGMIPPYSTLIFEIEIIDVK